ncbi:MAG: trans-2-enoyl-CoA reductase family protein [Spirochaetales bacterium]|nr:trans-2-enoyl-CoA reductase family protein [Spirochaetales bacterium]
MRIEAKIRNNICLTAHPLGCEEQVKKQINYVKNKGLLEGCKNALIIGSSNGYGLASRILASFGCKAKSIGISFEREGSSKHTATAGWYNEKAIEKLAAEEGLDSWWINGDAFSREIKAETARMIGEKLGKIDLLVYSIAAPRRKDPETGELFSSVLKPIGEAYTSKLMDFEQGLISETTLEPASEEEIAHTVKVMGGEDWMLWVDFLLKQDLLSAGFKTIAYSYIGPQLTAAIYRHGSIGEAKKDLEQKALEIDQKLKAVRGKALISVNKALVTRASAVIPGVSLYISLLYKVMKQKGIHEVCIEQIDRLFRHCLYGQGPCVIDEKGLLRLDDLEMREDVQAEVARLWEQISSQNIEAIADIQGFREEFLAHHGFGLEGIDYQADIEP